jgi:hypothetical protein
MYTGDMKKIPSLFKRNYDGDRLVYDEVVPGSEWVIEGEGIATRKFDGTACKIDSRGNLYKRYDCKKGKTPPAGFLPCEVTRDEHTGHWPGWVPITDDPQDKWFRSVDWRGMLPGTYELCGPKINGNPEGFENHVFIPHGHNKISEDLRTFKEIKEYLSNADIEGIVWHHPDGRMVKIKARDFGIKRK